MAAQPSMWYNDKIKEVVPVYDAHPEYYQYRGRKYQGNKIIFKCDASPLKQ